MHAYVPGYSMAWWGELQATVMEPGDGVQWSHVFGPRRHGKSIQVNAG
jgi:hypothetical protein